jgi:hypothetical protein
MQSKKRVRIHLLKVECSALSGEIWTRLRTDIQAHNRLLFNRLIWSIAKLATLECSGNLDWRDLVEESILVK